MELTPLQLEIQKLGADKSLSFGCMIIFDSVNGSTIGTILQYMCKSRFGDEYRVQYYNDKMYKDMMLSDENFGIIGHPITYSRLCYLYETNNLTLSQYTIVVDINDRFKNNPELYNQSILERPEELQLLVRDFLLSLQPND